MNKPKLSVVVLTHNEEKNIVDCLKSVRFANELVIIDDYSTDQTIELARQLGAIIYKRKLDDFASQRNFSLSKAKGEWVLFVDADERVTPELREEIKKAIRQDSSVYQIPRKNSIFGKFFSFTNWYPDYQTRLMKKGKAHYARSVHEQIATDNEVGTLTHEFVHYNYDTVDQFITKNFGSYANLEATHLIKEGYQFKWTDLINKPIDEFMRRFFAGKGYKDGLHGFIASVLVAMSVFVVYVKVWEQTGRKEQTIPIKIVSDAYDQKNEEMEFWLRKTLIDTERNPIKRLLMKLST